MRNPKPERLHPTKFHRSGVIVEVRQFDQYVVRIDGSGRVTLRNRKFLRKYVPVVDRGSLIMRLGPTPAPPVNHHVPSETKTLPLIETNNPEELNEQHSPANNLITSK